jgi:ribosomal protein L3 glutamine methyltransferase
LVMARLFHTDRALNVGSLITRVTRRLKVAKVFFGHGTDNARDEAFALVFHVMKLPHDSQRRFAPWIEPGRVRSLLDMGTGSGCIALACAKVFPKARVDATDIDAGALAVADINRRRLRLTRRVRLVESDHFAALSGVSYDIIVSNPPYVGEREMRGLPREYRHEPRHALASGREGLDSVGVILSSAARHLRPLGLLVVEVGNTERALMRAWPKVPFTWLEFERGGGGVFLLTREQLLKFWKV